LHGEYNRLYDHEPNDHDCDGCRWHRLELRYLDADNFLADSLRIQIEQTVRHRPGIRIILMPVLFILD